MKQRSALAELSAELAKTRQERAAAVSFILTIKRWDAFEQFVNLTSCHDYEVMERQIIERARAAYQRQQEYMRRTQQSKQ